MFYHHHHRHHHHHHRLNMVIYTIIINIIFISTWIHSQKIERYSHSGVTDYWSILFDVPRYQILVGARDNLIRLNIDNFNKSQKQVVFWPATEEAIRSCKQKGQSDQLCHNYIKVLLKGSKDSNRHNEIYVCGTNAFTPECGWRKLNQISQHSDNEDGKTKSPFSPLWNTTTLMTKEGDIYYGGPLNFMGLDTAVIRNSKTSPFLRTVQLDSKWLSSDTNFILSFEHNSFIYHLFRETAVEYINCGRVVYSRIARVCKGDTGGGSVMLKNSWTTFLKARLNCSIPGQFPFYFNEIQSATYLEDEKVVYAVFSTPENSIHGSAICSFSMTQVNRSFKGPFKYQSESRFIWESKEKTSKDDFECKVRRNSSSDESNLIQAENQKKFQLMAEAIASTNGRPLVVETIEKFTKITVDKVQTKFHTSVDVIFVVTASGELRRYVVWPFSTKACFLSQTQITAFGDEVLTMKILKDTHSLYIGTRKEVIKMSLSHCENYESREECLNSNDPYCGWNERYLKCSVAPGNLPQYTSYWIQREDTSCSDGKHYHWSAWKEWKECQQQNQSLGDICLCRERICSGIGCIQTSQTEVTNCTRHGKWSEWNPWSPCSSTCGRAQKIRSRACSNPSPAFGGRDCAGAKIETIDCFNPPCVKATTTTTESPQNIWVRQFLWSGWGEWEQCSAQCGGGIQLRRRKCLTPGNGPCAGCETEWRLCNQDKCAEVKRSSEWSNWYRTNLTSDRSGYVEERFKFACRAFNLAENNDLSITMRKEERFVNINEVPVNHVPSNNPWTECTAKCNGVQFQFDGVKYVKRRCNQNIECTEQNNGKDSFFEGPKFQFHGSKNQLNSDSSLKVNKKDKATEPQEIKSKPGSFPAIVIYILFTVMGFVLGSVGTCLMLRRQKIFDSDRHLRSPLKLFNNTRASNNAYVTTNEFNSNSKINNYNLKSTVGESLLLATSPPCSVSPSHHPYLSPPAKEATIKRTSTIRAKLNSDQNF